MSTVKPPKDQIEAILKRDGATCVRQKKHYVYTLSNGETFVLSKTPSAYRSYANHLAELKGMLGIKPKAKPYKAVTLVAKVVKKKAKKSVHKQLLVVSKSAVEEQALRNLEELAKLVPKPKVETEPEVLVYHPIRKVRESKPKGQVFTYKQEVLAEAARIRNENGMPAMNAYLAEQRELGEVNTVKPTKGSEEMPSILDLRIAGARELKQDLERRIIRCEEQFAEARRIIDTAEAVKAEAVQQMSMVNELLNWYDLAMEESKKVEPFLSVFQKQALAKATEPKKQTHSRILSPYKPTDMVRTIMEEWEKEPEKTFDVLALIKLLASRGMDIGTRKQPIYATVQSLKDRGYIKAIDKGVYGRILPSNSSTEETQQPTNNVG